MPGNEPNVVLITCHDLGQHLGCYGVDTVDTPALDGLAATGRPIRNAYATAPVCSPARGSLLTGRYPQSNGLMGLTHDPWGWSLDDDVRALPEVLSDAGYDTHLVGFQHVADPERLGFQATHATHVNPGDTTTAAEEVFDAAGDAPFYAQIGFFEVHRPFDKGRSDDQGVFVPPYVSESDEMCDDFARFQGSVELLDDRVAEILDGLEAAGMRDETVVVFAADHGIPHPGAKWTCRRPGLEISLLMDGPGPAFDGPTVEGVTSGVDLLPTVCDAAGVSVPDGVEGTSHYDHLVDGTGTPREVAFAQYTEDMKRDNESRCAITRDWHLIRYFDQGRVVEYPVDVDPVAFAAHEWRLPTAGERPFAHLYDIQEDPSELTDPSSEADHHDRVADLSAQLLRWMVDVDDPLLEGPVRLPYYERAIDDLLVRSSRPEA